MRYFALLVVVWTPLAAAQQNRSPAQQRIEAALKRVQADPKSVTAYNDLTAAFCRKARDTGELGLYDRAEAALQHTLQLSPGNYAARKLQVVVFLGRRQFAQALKLATEVNNQTHDDIGGWGLLVDANIALGNYAEAERDAQWILDLRRDSALGFEKAAGLRELFGDFEGAIEFYNEAILRTSQNDADQRAWLLTKTAHLQILSRNLKQAGELLDQALQLYPDSQLALGTLAKLRAARSATQ